MPLNVDLGKALTVVATVCCATAAATADPNEGHCSYSHVLQQQGVAAQYPSFNKGAQRRIGAAAGLSHGLQTAHLLS